MTAMDYLAELRKKMQSLNKDIPLLDKGNEEGIELDPSNFFHVNWYSDVQIESFEEALKEVEDIKSGEFPKRSYKEMMQRVKEQLQKET